MEKVLRFLKRFIPKGLFTALQPYYHFALSGSGALYYRFPSRKLYVVGVTGTKGKTSTTELVAAILEEAGYRVALSNTYQFRIAGKSELNLTKHSMLGRTKLQQFLQKAVKAGCTYAVIEMTSEGARQFRHAFIDLDALIFTNLSPEHLESHGSYKNYVQAKISLARALERGNAGAHAIIANADDREAERFLSVSVGTKLTFRLEDGAPYTLLRGGSHFTWRGTPIQLNLAGEFNVRNALGAATFAAYRGVTPEVIRRALERVALIPGRMQKIESAQPFTVIVDYAHTADSLEKAYAVYAGTPIIAVLGGAGGGRDRAKRAVMGSIADRYAEHIILTTEDPYDESPEAIVQDIKEGITKHIPEIILDRREAIRRALSLARKDSVVFITGKGAEPYIMGPKGTKVPWSDAAIAQEELRALPALA